MVPGEHEEGVGRSVDDAMTSTPLLLFAHGAGAGSCHPWMRQWVKLLDSVGDVRTFDYPYMATGSRRPDRLPKLIAAHRTALDAQRRFHPGPVVLIGKSMGGRIGCHVALEEKVDALICLGYPLCGGGDCEKLRDEVLRKLSTPILFVQGTRDSLCPLDVLKRVRAQIPCPNELVVVRGGDHSLVVTKKQLKEDGETQEAVDSRVLDAIQSFVACAVRRPEG